MSEIVLMVETFIFYYKNIADSPPGIIYHDPVNLVPMTKAACLFSLAITMTNTKPFLKQQQYFATINKNYQQDQ